jgi:hypothetical protein
VFFREVIRSRQSMTTAANDDDVVLFLGLRIAPRRLPFSVMA